MKRWQFVPGAESIDPVGNGDVVLENVAVPTIGGPKPMVGTAASRRHDAEQQAPGPRTHMGCRCVSGERSVRAAGSGQAVVARTSLAVTSATPP